MIYRWIFIPNSPFNFYKGLNFFFRSFENLTYLFQKFYPSYEHSVNREWELRIEESRKSFSQGGGGGSYQICSLSK